MKTKQKEQIIRHGNALNAIFNTGLDPIALCKKLHRIENEAHKMAENYCNGVVDSESYEKATEYFLQKVDKIIHFTEKKIPVFVNGDPRGYALKIDDQYIRDNNIFIYSDWGGYGILAPEF